MTCLLAKCDIEAAMAALANCVPGASLSPDALFDAAKTAGYSPAFQQIHGSEDMSKSQLFDLMFSGQEIPGGRVFVVADSVLPSSALTYDGHALRDAVLEDQSFLFDGDLLFVWPDLRVVAVFHHEGGYFHIRS